MTGLLLAAAIAAAYYFTVARPQIRQLRRQCDIRWELIKYKNGVINGLAADCRSFKAEGDHYRELTGRLDRQHRDDAQKVGELERRLREASAVRSEFQAILSRLEAI